MTSLSFNSETSCIILIGMAGSGKTTIGKHLAKELQWALIDTDHLMEAAYSTPLQNISDVLTKNEFLDLEAQFITRLQCKRSVIATGGSVVYRPEAMAHLSTLGLIVHIYADLPTILQRIALNPQRGLAIAPGQTVEDLFYERQELYEKYCSFTVQTHTHSAAACTIQISNWLKTL